MFHNSYMDNVTFGNTGVGALSITAAGVTLNAVTFSHSSGTYALSGGPIAAMPR